MSGGVDSSVAAALLKNLPAGRQGRAFDVVGIYMKCWSEGEYCTSAKDAEDARLVAEKLNIPFYVFDFTREYREKVFEYMVREYAAGRTPNPDVFCNSEIKFGIFLEKCLALGADYIATGHYVRSGASQCSIAQTGSSPLQLRRLPALSAKIQPLTLTAYKEGAEPSIFACESFSQRKHRFASAQSLGWSYHLLEAKDRNKDQSYFLWRLNQEQLKHVLFPIGDYLKSEVREMAREFGLPTAEKKDSQGLCFVGNVSFDNFLRDFIPKNSGPIMTASGKKIGDHDGLSFYTIGQRHGIGIGGGTPYYVAAKEPATNTLIVSEGNIDPALYKKEIEISDLNWINPFQGLPLESLECEARIRYRQPLQKCRIQLGNPVSKLRVVFDEPQRAVTPGQSAVFYKDEEMLGGGIIVK